MKHSFFVGMLVGLILCLGGLQLIDYSQTANPVPQADTTYPAGSHQGSPPPRRPSYQAPELVRFPATPLGHALDRHLRLTERLDPNAEQAYAQSLAHLRTNAVAAVRLLTRAYADTPPDRYLDRWKLVDALAGLEHPRALSPLVDIAQAAIPAERYRATGFSSRSEELMIRQAAVRGIERLARAGVPAAETALIRVIEGAQHRVRKHAVVAYLRSGPDTAVRKAQLRARLPLSDAWMLDARELAAVRLPGKPAHLERMRYPLDFPVRTHP